MKTAKITMGIIFVAALFATAMPIYANNIQVGEPTLTGGSASEDYTFVQFDLSWDNSWRTDSTEPYNYDAAWVFVKYKPMGGDWAHATLHTSGHSVTTDNGVAATINTPADGKGVFIYRTNDSTGGSINWDGVQLRWDYGADGLSDETTVTVKVFAIEMVYVPQGAFYIGDADKDQRYCFFTYGTTGPYQVTGAGTINIGQINGYLWAESNVGIEASTLPAAFPKGYNAFYCMKYETSQEQYADFLNTLTATQDGTRFPNFNGSSRHTIGGSPGSRSAGVPDRACNYLSWADGAAYADWAGLRPMTELEFEKVCRGTQAVADDEYAWGNANIASSAYNLINNGQPTETVSNAASFPTGNASYRTTVVSIGGPLRCGIFATNNSTRAEAGASFYGVMEMTGNVVEPTVTIGNSDGRNFTGVHGDGSLDSNGNANVPNWPGTNAVGTRFRGGSWLEFAVEVRMSCRSAAANANRIDISGFRGVRSAP